MQLLDAFDCIQSTGSSRLDPVDWIQLTGPVRLATIVRTHLLAPVNKMEEKGRRSNSKRSGGGRIPHATKEERRHPKTVMPAMTRCPRTLWLGGQ